MSCLRTSKRIRAGSACLCRIVAFGGALVRRRGSRSADKPAGRIERVPLIAELPDANVHDGVLRAVVEPVGVQRPAGIGDGEQLPSVGLRAGQSLMQDGILMQSLRECSSLGNIIST